MSQFDRIEQSQIEKIAKKVVAASGGSGGGSGTVTQVNSGTGLTGGPITTTGTLNVSFGTSGTTACVGNDARLSDSRTPTAHTHSQSDITNLVTDLAGKASTTHTHAAADITSGVIATARLASSGTASATTFLRGDQRWATPTGLTVTDGDYGDITVSGTGSTWTIDNSTVTVSKINATGTPSGTTFLRGDGTWSAPSGSGTVTQVDSGTGLTGGPITSTGTLSVSFGTTASTACVGNDSRLSDARTPLSHTHAAADITSGVIDTARLASTGTPSATTFLRGDQQWATPAGGSLSISRSILTATQVNSTTTPAVLTGCTFTLTPGQSLTLSANLIFTAAATTTGGALGVRVAQAASANANATGSAVGYVNLTSAASATGLCDGDVFNVAGGANSLFAVVGTATVAGNNAARIEAVVWNQSTNVNTTVTVEFRSEVAGSAVTAQIGSGAVAIIG